MPQLGEIPFVIYTQLIKVYPMSHSEKKTWWQRCIQILLFPVILPISLVMLAFMVIVMLVMVPVLAISNYFEGKARWARLRKRGLVGQWSDVVKALETGGNTLIIETFKKPPTSAVLIHHPRTSLDPEQSISTWHDIESDSLKAWNELDAETRRAKVEDVFETQRIIKEKLFAIMESPDTPFKVVQLRKHQLNELSQSVKENQTIVFWVDHESDNVWDVLQRISVGHAVHASP